MALDGIYLAHVAREIKETSIDSRLEKVYQPNKEEIILQLRNRSGSKKLLLSARANSPRVCYTDFSLENPKSPPMLCMLLRKRLGSAKLKNVYQPGLERLLFLEFEAINELGDLETLRLAIEIMGKYSNVILIDGNDIIIDALKRVDMTMSSRRLVLPSVKYEFPPAQSKLSLLESGINDIIYNIENSPAEKHLNKAILDTTAGLSPVICREIEYLAASGKDITNRELTENHREKLDFYLKKLKSFAQQANGEPYLVSDSNGVPIDFSFMPINQYGSAAKLTKGNSFSEVLDNFYFERDKSDRMRARSQDLLHLITNIIERLSRKISAQQAELTQCADREHLRICGDLIQANINNIPKGSVFADLQNFYSEDCSLLRVKLDPALTPTQNSQKYYKDYRKAKTAEQVLKEQIDRATAEIEYMETVFDSLTRADSESDLSEIREELADSGYLRRIKSKQKPPKALPPLEFTSSDGFTILVGRNNRQNDKLTLKMADKNDIWFHTKNIPGSHTVIITQGREVPDSTIIEAAQLAAYHSKAKMSAQVPVDYTTIRNVSKPQGAKYGMVIYVKNKTVYVTPKTIKGNENE